MYSIEVPSIIGVSNLGVACVMWVILGVLFIHHKHTCFYVVRCRQCQVGWARSTHWRSPFSDVTFITKATPISIPLSFRPRLSPKSLTTVFMVSWSIYYSFGDRSIYFGEINIFNIQLHNFLVSPAHYTPKLGFPDIFWSKGVYIIHECVQYTEEYSKFPTTASMAITVNGRTTKGPSMYLWGKHHDWSIILDNGLIKVNLLSKARWQLWQKSI